MLLKIFTAAFQSPVEHEPPLPIPIPHKNVKGRITKKEKDEIESSQFAAKAVEPKHAVGIPLPRRARHYRALAGVASYVSGVDDAKGVELMYFEIPMGK